MSVGLVSSNKILINGFITSGGQKMSKSLGNVLNPMDFISKYSADALRYFIARELSQAEDSDVTEERFREAYNANLANGLGNLVSRVLKMAVTNNVSLSNVEGLKFKKSEALEKFEIQKAANVIWESIRELDGFIQKEEPFKKIKTDPASAKRDIAQLLAGVYEIALDLQPFMPATAEKILSAFAGGVVKEVGALFPRK